MDFTDQWGLRAVVNDSREGRESALKTAPGREELGAWLQRPIGAASPRD